MFSNTISMNHQYSLVITEVIYAIRSSPIKLVGIVGKVSRF